ncbi:MAG: hypothetical protein BV459_06695 [Thermoplasmata archaeon M11B2D]|nr:MAG: hypothetical protein BV459_06695 [Thermoplasmata archaeon M11B2D]PNX51205.1 MAG: hypothetical protein BV458_11865 [Thermoplasmata archaeon M9B2D]
MIKTKRHNLGQVSLETSGDGQRPSGDDLDGTMVPLRSARRLALQCLFFGVVAGGSLGFAIAALLLRNWGV